MPDFVLHANIPHTHTHNTHVLHANIPHMHVRAHTTHTHMHTRTHTTQTHTHTQFGFLKSHVHSAIRVVLPLAFLAWKPLARGHTDRPSPRVLQAPQEPSQLLGFSFLRL